MPRKPLPLNIDHAIRLYETGVPLEEVGRELGVSRATLARRLRDAGYQVRSGQAAVQAYWRAQDAALDLDHFFRRYQDGEGAVALAQEAGIDPRRFIRLLRESGITPRTLRENVGLRYTRMTKAEREALTEAAHTAKRGRPANPAALERRAKTMEVTLQLASRADLALAVWLAQRGIQFTLQKAVGPYNIDIAVHEPLVAVEVNGRDWHGKLRHYSRSRTTPSERRDYLLNRGWRLIEVDVAAGAKWLRPACADRIVALLKETSSPEPIWGQHCVIRSDGEMLTGLEHQLDDRP